MVKLFPWILYHYRENLIALYKKTQYCCKSLTYFWTYTINLYSVAKTELSFF